MTMFGCRPSAILVLNLLLLCSSKYVQAAQDAEHFQTIRDVLFPRLYIAESRDEPQEKWQQSQFMRISSGSGIAMKVAFSPEDLPKLVVLGKEVCLGTRIIDVASMTSPATTSTTSKAWTTTRVYLTIPGDQRISVSTFTGTPNSRNRVQIAVSTDYADCPRNGEANLAIVGPIYEFRVVTKDASGWNLTVTDATLVYGRTELPNLADGTDRSFQSFRVGVNAFPFVETHSLRGQKKKTSAWLGWLGLGGNVSLLDFNHNGSIEPGVGVILAPAPLHRVVFFGVGWNLVVPSKAQFDPGEPNRLVHLRDRQYIFIGVSGLSLKKWIDDRRQSK